MYILSFDMTQFFLAFISAARYDLDMYTRYRVRIKDQTVGISVYAHSWAIEQDDSELALTDSLVFYTETGMYVAVFPVESVEKVLTGPTADDIVWENKLLCN